MYAIVILTLKVSTLDLNFHGQISFIHQDLKNAAIKNDSLI